MTPRLGLAAKAAVLILFQESVLLAYGVSLRRAVLAGSSSSNPVDDARPLRSGVSRTKLGSQPGLNLLGAVNRTQAVAQQVAPAVHASAVQGGKAASSTEDDKTARVDSGLAMGPETREATNKSHNVLKDRFGRFRLQAIMKEEMNDEIRQQFVHTDWLNNSVANWSTTEAPEWTSHCKCPEYQWYYADHPSHPMCMNKGHAGYACGFFPASAQASACGFGLGCIDGSWCAQCTKDEECACGSCNKITGECGRDCQDKECVTVTVFADDSGNASATETQEVTLFWDMEEELGSQGGAGAAGHATEVPTKGNFTTMATASATKQVIKRAIVTAAQCQPCGEKLEGTRAAMVADSEQKALGELTNKTQPKAKRSCEVEAKWRAQQEARSRAYRKARKAAQALVDDAKAKVRTEIESKKMPGSDLTDRLFR